MLEEFDNSELEEFWGKDTSRITPAVKEIILSALKKAREKLSKK